NDLRSKSRPSSSGALAALSTASLAALIASAGFAAILRAMFLASSRNSSTGRTRLTRPSRSASAAPIRSPVSTSSMARCLPSKWVRRWVPPLPGMMPRLTSGWPKRALSEAMMISPHRQLAAAAERKAAHGRDQRLGDLVDAVAVNEPLLNALVEGAALGHFLDVGAGGEDFFPAGYDDGANFGIGLQFFERQAKIFDQRVRQGVQRLRPIHRDDADGAVLFDEDGFETARHGDFRHTPRPRAIQSNARRGSARLRSKNRRRSAAPASLTARG